MRGLQSSEVDSLHPLASDYRWSLQQNPFLRGAGIRRHPARADGECVGALQRLCALFETDRHGETRAARQRPHHSGEHADSGHIFSLGMPDRAASYLLQNFRNVGSHEGPGTIVSWCACSSNAFPHSPGFLRTLLLDSGGLRSRVVREVQLTFKVIENKGFKEERMTKVGLYAIGKSTTLESNKSQRQNYHDSLLDLTFLTVANALKAPIY
jgi:hypothetical protein